MSYETLKNARKCKKRDEKFKTLISGNDKASKFYEENFARMFGYIQNRIPEISNDITSIDAALKTGFGWKDGPFEIWNYIGVKEGVELMKNFDLADQFYEIHILSNYTLIGLIVLHISAVIAHKLFFGDNLLKRIL